ncbi:MAG: hypothetical protein RL685_2716 [Pseudomonadota bacterium]
MACVSAITSNDVAHRQPVSRTNGATMAAGTREAPRIPSTVESEWRVEQAVRALGFPSETILRPVDFMENVLGPWTLQGNKLVSWTAPDSATTPTSRTFGRATASRC